MRNTYRGEKSVSNDLFCSFRDAVDMLNALYNQVDEEVHKLVILSNKSQKQLESLLDVRKFEEQTQQVSSNYFTFDLVFCAAYLSCPV